MQTEFGIYHRLESCESVMSSIFYLQMSFSYFLCKLESWSSSMHSIKMKVTHASKCCAIAFAQNVVCAKALLWLFTTDVTILRSSLFEAFWIRMKCVANQGYPAMHEWMSTYTLFLCGHRLPKSLRLRTLIYWCSNCIRCHLSTVPVKTEKSCIP